MDRYTFALTNLLTLSDEEFRSIPECNREVVGEIAQAGSPQKIISKEQKWLFDLCYSISPSKEESHEHKRPFPKYIPSKSVKIGGEAILFTAWDQWREEKIILKIPRPIFSVKKNDTPEQKKTEGIIKGGGLFNKILYRKKLAEEEKTDKKKEFKSIEAGEQFQRFHRSYSIQDQLCRISRRVDPERKLGYIPSMYEFGAAPHCYISSEYVIAVQYLDYIRSHSDRENINLFIKMVQYIEKVCHSYGVAHCDLGAKNIIVQKDYPVVLDFGIAKVPKLPEITVDNAQLGTYLYSSPHQLDNARERGFLDDVFSLGRLLWVTLNKREPVVECLSEEEIDYEKIKQVFDPFFVPENLRSAFTKSQNDEYSDISEFRADLERVYLPRTATQKIAMSQKCKGPCEELRLMSEQLQGLEEKIERLFLALSQNQKG